MVIDYYCRKLCPMSTERELKSHFAVKIKCCRLSNLASNICNIHITKPTSRQRCSYQVVCNAAPSAQIRYFNDIPASEWSSYALQILHIRELFNKAFATSQHQMLYDCKGGGKVISVPAMNV